MEYFGLDVHKRYTVFTQLDEGGRLLGQGRVGNDAESLCGLLSRNAQPAKVVPEAGGFWPVFTEALEVHAVEVVLAHPMRTCAIASARIKTDRIDSATLAHLLRTDLVPRSYLAPRLREVREVLHCHVQLLRLPTAVKNRVHALLAMRGLASPVSNLFGRAMGLTLRWLAVLTLVLSACSTAAPPQPAATSAPAAANGPATTTVAAPAAPAASQLSGEMTYAWWGTTAFRNQVTQDVINLFQQKYPNVKIDPAISDFNNHFQKLTVQAAAGDMPCLPQMQSTGLQAYADPRILRPLDDLVENKTIDVSNVPKGARRYRARLGWRAVHDPDRGFLTCRLLQRRAAATGWRTAAAGNLDMGRLQDLHDAAPGQAAAGHERTREQRRRNEPARDLGAKPRPTTLSTEGAWIRQADALAVVPVLGGPA
jgi:transposase